MPSIYFALGLHNEDRKSWSEPALRSCRHDILTKVDWWQSHEMWILDGRTNFVSYMLSRLQFKLFARGISPDIVRGILLTCSVCAVTEERSNTCQLLTATSSFAYIRLLNISPLYREYWLNNDFGSIVHQQGFLISNQEGYGPHQPHHQRHIACRMARIGWIRLHE